jgi:hypothetical protein
MLGWYVDTDKLEPGRYSRIQASVKGRSGMTVRVRQGSLDLSKFVSTPQAKR